jgi:hypothetical protein
LQYADRNPRGNTRVDCVPARFENLERGVGGEVVSADTTWRVPMMLIRAVDMVFLMERTG